MSLSRKQASFLTDFAKLVLFINESTNMYCTAGEGYRTMYQQREHLRTGASKTLKSKHLRRLAEDINIFYGGRPIWEQEKVRQIEILAPVRVFWNSLHLDNDCGLNWGWDFGHFERK